MGQIATMLTSVTRTRSPLQKELDSLTKVLGVIAWTRGGAHRGRRAGPRAVGDARCCCSARRWPSPPSPPACPTFVSAMLSYGAKQLAEAKAVVKNLTDVETLGATSAINTDKTGTLTMNQMMVSTLYVGRLLVHGRGRGLPQDRAHPVGRRRAGRRTSPASPTAWRSTATPPWPTTAPSSATPPRRRSSCWPRSSASTPRRPAGPTRASPRCRSTPSTSSWPRSTASPSTGPTASSSWSRAGPTWSSPAAASRRAARSAARQCRSTEARRRHRGGQRADGREGAARARLRGAAARRGGLPAMHRRPDVASPSDLVFVGMVGIIDPLRAEAKGAVPDRARGRHRRADDHRRPRRHRPGDRREARPRAGRDQRRRARRRCPTTSWLAGCPSSTCSAASRPRTSCAWPGSCSSRG